MHVVSMGVKLGLSYQGKTQAEGVIGRGVDSFGSG